MGSETSTAQENFHRQIEIYQNTEKRTIVVEGQSELLEPPNVLYLSFKTTVEDSTIRGAIRKCMANISKIRAKAVQHGVPNENVASDSIGTEAKKIEYGKYIASD